MSIGKIQGGIGETATKVFESVKDAAIWAGHQITKGFNKFVELVKAAWNVVFPFLKDVAIRTTDFLRTAPGIGLVLGATSMVLGYNAIQNHDKKWLSLALQVATVATAIGTGAVLGYGYATGLNTPLI